MVLRGSGLKTCRPVIRRPVTRRPAMRHGLRAATVATVAAGALFASTGTAAAATPVNVNLGGLGMTTSACPTPSNVAYVPPGATVRFTGDASGLAPATGGLTSVQPQTTFTNPLNNAQSFTVGYGAAPYQDITFGGPGAYSFTWTANFAGLQVGLLGAQLPVTVGAKPVVSGAKATWQGQIVVSSQAQGCTLAPQVPSITVPGVGPLPGIRLPGVQAPGVNVPLPGTAVTPVAPTVPPVGTAPAPAPFTYTRQPDCTGPCLVVPHGGGNGGVVGGAYDVVMFPDRASGGSGSAGTATSGSTGGGKSAASSPQAAPQNSVNAQNAANSFGLADRRTDPGLRLPTTLALLAILALGAATISYTRRLASRDR